jgi:predicted hotdog family 3-hydroxylacyl-ACP dehydratase
MTMTEAVLPISVKEVEKYLPHRPPMVWIDEVLAFSEKSGECRLRLQADAHYLDAGHLRPSCCLEFIAQAYGFISVCHHIYILDPRSKPLSKAFLASIKDAVLPTAEVLETVGPGDEIRIVISGVRQMGPIVLFQGRVARGDLILCETEMKVFKEYEA